MNLNQPTMFKISTTEHNGMYTTEAVCNDITGNGNGFSLKSSQISALGQLLNKMGKDKVYQLSSETTYYLHNGRVKRIKTTNTL